ncbi:MAG: MBL fold metallo-hydrolase [Acidobacteriota bacterium]|nr:MBL fold metallo-hydrolase [Acidobacteriota bacterium]
MKILAFCWLLATGLQAGKSLEVYFVDVEGGQATLVVSPSGQSLLIDTGWRGFNGRDAGRIVEAAKAAKIKQLDYVLITHYHRDHVGGVTQLVDRMKVGTFLDHGPNTEDSKVTREDYADYEKVLGRAAQHVVLKPGDTVPVKGITVQVIAANGEHIAKPLDGAGQPNPLCSSAAKREPDPTENARSLGVLITYGSFRLLDLGDLTWNKELELACPNNLIGTVDVYLTTHHGSEPSGPPQIVHALHPRVAIMNNGAKKGGNPKAWQIVKDSPGLEDLWQVHYAMEGGREHNAADTYIANVDEFCEGKSLKLTAESNGAFTVTNSRNKYQKSYAAGAR